MRDPQIEAAEHLSPIHAIGNVTEFDHEGCSPQLSCCASIPKFDARTNLGSHMRPSERICNSTPAPSDNLAMEKNVSTPVREADLLTRRPGDRNPGQSPRKILGNDSRSGARRPEPERSRIGLRSRISRSWSETVSHSPQRRFLPHAPHRARRTRLARSALCPRSRNVF